MKKKAAKEGAISRAVRNKKKFEKVLSKADKLGLANWMKSESNREPGDFRLILKQISEYPELKNLFRKASDNGLSVVLDGRDEQGADGTIHLPWNPWGVKQAGPLTKQMAETLIAVLEGTEV